MHTSEDMFPLQLRAEMLIKLLRNEASLRVVLDHKHGRQLFDMYLKAEFADESLRYYELIEGMEGRMKGKKAPSLAELRSMVDEYVVNNAPLQVNIPSKLQKSIIAQLVDADKQPWDQAAKISELWPQLRKAQRELYELMAKDNFRRFKASSPWSSLLESLGAYSDDVKHLLSEMDVSAVQDENDAKIAAPDKVAEEAAAVLAAAEEPEPVPASRKSISGKASRGSRFSSWGRKPQSSA